MKIACIGDSLTQCRDLPLSDSWVELVNKNSEFNCTNFGIHGDSSSGIISRFQRELDKDNFSHCFIMCGTNDIWYGAEWRQILPNIYGMISEARYRSLTPIIGIPGLLVLPNPDNDPFELFPPIDGYDVFIKKMQDYHEILLKLCKSESLCTIDLFNALCLSPETNEVNTTLFLSDGLHLNAKGCRIMADLFVNSCRDAGLV